eukprot:sb/3465799/
MIDFEGLQVAEEGSGGKEEEDSGPSREVLQKKLEQVQNMYLELLETRTGPVKTDGYFESYADYSIHHQMLSDRARTEVYRDYIYNNPAVFEGRDVLDIGCGTGILSMFCARGGGARAVTAVDNSRIVDKAKAIVKLNNLTDIINVVDGKAEDLPSDQKYDVIVSEWMGYGLLFECMLDSVIATRDKLLKPGGTMVPSRASLIVSLLSDLPALESRTKFWKNVYGFDMSCMASQMDGEAVVQSVEADKVISTDCGFKHFDLGTVKVEELEFSSSFKVEITKPGPLTAVCIHFTCNFDGAEFSACLDTSPKVPETHWLQTVLYLPNPVTVKEGEVVTGSVGYMKSKTNKRGYVLLLCGHTESGQEFDQTYQLN